MSAVFTSEDVKQKMTVTRRNTSIAASAKYTLKEIDLFVLRMRFTVRST